MRATFGVKLYVVGLRRLYAFQASCNFLLYTVRKPQLLEHDAQVSITAKPPSGPYLNHSARQNAALRQYQMAIFKQRPRDHGLDRIALLVLRGRQKTAIYFFKTAAFNRSATPPCAIV